MYPAAQEPIASPSSSIANHPLLRFLLQRWRHLMRHVDRDATNMQVLEEGGLSYSYVFLAITACGIATLGLMLNSAAVIIGAMLVAPLMGPIVLLGFSIASTNVEKAIRSAKALAVGVAAALAISVSIVKLSPYIPPTPEILARTSPNLFDLLVAVLSGMVAGYAVTNRKVGAVAGVAIATALMPPLAASGYGLAMGDMHIFQGAFLLFLTNMLAIALSVAGMAVWYGFGNLHTPRTLIWQTALAGAILVVLSIPLVKTLNASVAKTLATREVEAVLRKDLQLKGASLDKLDVRMAEGEPVEVEAVVFTHQFDKAARERLLPQLRERLGRPVALALDQVVLGDARSPSGAGQSVIANPVGTASSADMPLTDTQLLVRHLREILPLPLMLSEIDPSKRTARFQLAPSFAGDLSSVRQMEALLQQRFPEWQVALIPPLRPLPDIRFPQGKADMEAADHEAIKIAVWALNRWQVKHVRVLGSASLNESGRKTRLLAAQRAEATARLLTASGIESQPTVVYPQAAQHAHEKEQGQSAWRFARIEL